MEDPTELGAWDGGTSAKYIGGGIHDSILESRETGKLETRDLHPQQNYDSKMELDLGPHNPGPDNGYVLLQAGVVS